jgi:hypothetical protein
MATDDVIDRILNDHWEQIALFAFDHFIKRGRGVVGIENKGGQIRLSYITYDFESTPHPEAIRFIAEYNPEWEIVIQCFRQDGSLRTMRVKTAPEARHPWRIWWFDTMIKEDGLTVNDLVEEKDEG